VIGYFSAYLDGADLKSSGQPAQQKWYSTPWYTALPTSFPFATGAPVTGHKGVPRVSTYKPSLIIPFGTSGVGAAAKV